MWFFITRNFSTILHNEVQTYYEVVFKVQLRKNKYLLKIVTNFTKLWWKKIYILRYYKASDHMFWRYYLFLWVEVHPTQLSKGTFFNYVDQILAFFWPPTYPGRSTRFPWPRPYFDILRVDKKSTFLNHLPTYLVS